jgi:hypothetical protein
VSGCRISEWWWRRGLFRIVHARGAIPNEWDQHAIAQRQPSSSRRTRPAPRPPNACLPCPCHGYTHALSQRVGTTLPLTLGVLTGSENERHAHVSFVERTPTFHQVENTSRLQASLADDDNTSFVYDRREKTASSARGFFGRSFCPCRIRHLCTVLTLASFCEIQRRRMPALWRGFERLQWSTAEFEFWRFITYRRRAAFLVSFRDQFLSRKYRSAAVACVSPPKRGNSATLTELFGQRRVLLPLDGVHHCALHRRLNHLNRLDGTSRDVDQAGVSEARRQRRSALRHDVLRMQGAAQDIRNGVR